MKSYISRRNFLKAAGAMTGAAAALGLTAAPVSADGLFYPLVAPDKHPITILYTNDVHTYIDNEAPELTYASIEALKKSYEDADMDVLLVDAGDHIQGTAYGAMDQGASIIKLMNSAGYDLATLGNHEFDYGMDRIMEIVNEEANFPYVSCNFKDLRTGKNVLPSIKYFFRGGRILAFIGVTTPETITKSTPAYFMDAGQNEYIYGIDGGDDGQALYDAVQKAIDEAWLYADFVIGLGHLGVDGSSSPYTSREVIQHTVGFNAFIDGHSHTEMPGETVRDAEGNPVVLTQTGCYPGQRGPHDHRHRPQLHHRADLLQQRQPLQRDPDPPDRLDQRGGRYAGREDRREPHQLLHQRPRHRQPPHPLGGDQHGRPGGRRHLRLLQRDRAA